LVKGARRVTLLSLFLLAAALANAVVFVAYAVLYESKVGFYSLNTGIVLFFLMIGTALVCLFLGLRIVFRQTGQMLEQGLLREAAREHTLAKARLRLQSLVLLVGTSTHGIMFTVRNAERSGAIEARQVSIR
jgi:hypothetical protein